MLMLNGPWGIRNMARRKRGILDSRNLAPPNQGN